MIFVQFGTNGSAANLEAPRDTFWIEWTALRSHLHSCFRPFLHATQPHPLPPKQRLTLAMSVDPRELGDTV